ncbi:MAG: hypothetical protein JWM82_1011, partial [Myxococcales bacterium]|nr:hypothetical protein [Myxococcales bacterium]
MDPSRGGGAAAVRIRKSQRASDTVRVPLEIVDDYRDSAFARAQTGLLFNLPVPPPEAEHLPAGISLCMIVKNEERFLAECL